MKYTCVAMLAFVCMVTSASERKYEVYDLNEAPQLFEKFVTDYKREYKDEEDRKIHYDTFVKSLGTINKLNAESTSATFGINQFADQTEEERKKMRGIRI